MVLSTFLSLKATKDKSQFRRIKLVHISTFEMMHLKSKFTCILLKKFWTVNFMCSYIALFYLFLVINIWGLIHLYRYARKVASATILNYITTHAAQSFQVQT